MMNVAQVMMMRLQTRGNFLEDVRCDLTRSSDDLIGPNRNRSRHREFDDGGWYEMVIGTVRFDCRKVMKRRRGRRRTMRNIQLNLTRQMMKRIEDRNVFVLVPLDLTRINPDRLDGVVFGVRCPGRFGISRMTGG